MPRAKSIIDLLTKDICDVDITPEHCDLITKVENNIEKKALRKAMISIKKHKRIFSDGGYVNGQEAYDDAIEAVKETMP